MDHSSRSQVPTSHAEKIDALKAKLTYAKVEVAERSEHLTSLTALVSVYSDWMKGHHAVVDGRLSTELSDVKSRAFALEKKLAKTQKAMEEDQASLNKVCNALPRLWNRRP